MSNQNKREQVQVGFGPSELDDINDWRRRQDTIPSRAQAIRRLIRAGLKAEEATPKYPEIRN